MLFFSILQLFKEDPETGLTHMALSSDSTCVNHLYSAQDGYETLHMEKIEHGKQSYTVAVAGVADKYRVCFLHIPNSPYYSFSILQSKREI